MGVSLLETLNWNYGDPLGKILIVNWYGWWTDGDFKLLYHEQKCEHFFKTPCIKDNGEEIALVVMTAVANIYW